MRTLTSTKVDTSDVTTVAKVKTGQTIRCSGWSTWKTVASHCEGYLRGVSVAFTNGDSLVAQADTLVEVK